MSIYEIAATTIDGRNQTLVDYRGQVLLVVNVASKCGFTPQYTGLEALYRKYKDTGFTVLGFPCDQFGHQEPGDEAEIQQFCSTRYEVSFPLFAKIDVKSEKSGLFGTEGIKWNFTKFLIDREGNVVKRYAPTTTPDKIAGDIAPLLDH